MRGLFAQLCQFYGWHLKCKIQAKILLGKSQQIQRIGIKSQDTNYLTVLSMVIKHVAIEIRISMTGADTPKNGRSLAGLSLVKGRRSWLRNKR